MVKQSDHRGVRKGSDAVHRQHDCSGAGSDRSEDRDDDRSLVSRQKYDALMNTCAALEEQAQRQAVINEILHLSIERCDLDQVLLTFLDRLVTFPELGLEPSGVVFLQQGEDLVIKAHKNVPAELVQKCAVLPVGTCLCGLAFSRSKVIFDHGDSPEHVLTYEGMTSHSHYCVPILSVDQKALGVVTLFLEPGKHYDKKVEDILVTSAGVLAAIIEQKQTEAQLAEQGELLTSIYGVVDSVALIVADLKEADARIVTFSPGAEKMFGYSAQEAIGQSIAIINTKENVQGIPSRVKRLRQGKAFQAIDMAMRRKSGVTFPAVLNIHPLTPQQDGTIRVIGVYSDVSALKQAQVELEHANIELEKRVNQRTLELQSAQRQILHAEKLSAIGRLSASIAHEFNNPLQGIKAVLKGIASRPKSLDREDEKLVTMAIQECIRMSGLIRDLQHFNRPTSGLFAWIDIHQAIESILLLQKSHFNKNKIVVTTVFDPSIPAVRVVPDQFKQVVVNLLTNAVDACEGGGTIEIRSKLHNEDHVLLSIEDSGIGILPDTMKHIFDPFFTTKPDVMGTGLGLSVCYGIVKKHMGEIQVSSQPGKGSTFTVMLPVKGDA